MQAMRLRRSKTMRHKHSKTMHRHRLLMMRRPLLRPRNAKRPLRLPRLWTILTTIFHSKKPLRQPEKQNGVDCAKKEPQILL